MHGLRPNPGPDLSPQQVSRLPRPRRLHLWPPKAEVFRALRSLLAPLAGGSVQRQLAWRHHAAQCRLCDEKNSRTSPGRQERVRLRAHPRRRGASRPSFAPSRDRPPPERVSGTTTALRTSSSGRDHSRAASARATRSPGRARSSRATRAQIRQPRRSRNRVREYRGCKRPVFQGLSFVRSFVRGRGGNRTLVLRDQNRASPSAADFAFLGPPDRVSASRTGSAALDHQAPERPMCLVFLLAMPGPGPEALPG